MTDNHNNDSEDLVSDEEDGDKTQSSKESTSNNTTSDHDATTAKQLSTLTEAIQQLTKSMTENTSSSRSKRKSDDSHTVDSLNPVRKKAKKAPISRDSSVSELAQKAGNSSSSEEDCEIMLENILNDSTHGPKKSGADGKSPESEDELLSELLREYESDDVTSDKLKNEQLAKLVNKMFRSKIAEKTLKDKMEKQTRPGNC